MKYIILSNFFAETYGCGTYGGGGFNENQCTTGALSATGTDVAIGIGIGIVLIVLAVVLILRSRKKK